MSLTFGNPALFQFRFNSKPQREGVRVPMQKTEMFGGIGASFLRGAKTTGKISYTVVQDGFANQVAANAFVDAVIDSQGETETLIVTGRPNATAVLMSFAEDRISLAGGTTTGWSVRGVLTFEEVAT